jgi:hypothetical protein
MAAPYYLSGATLYFRESEPRPTAHPDWFEVQITDRGTSVLLRASNQAGSIAGKVVEKTKGVPAIPVFLWPVAAETRRKAGGPRVLETNAAGEFKFEALPPGAYRVMASFDYDEVDDDVILAANGPVFSSGHDLNELSDRPNDEYEALFAACTTLMTRIQSIPQPVIADYDRRGIHGSCRRAHR